MEIVRLPVGKQAPFDTDCIRIEEQPGSQFKLTGSALSGGLDDSESVTIGEASLFETEAQAEAAGTVWASDLGIERLFVSIGTLERPLEVLEMDKPL